MDLVSRLKQYLTARSISITQFADECDIPRPSASQLLAGRNKKVSDEIISKIHYTYPDLSISWLMFGEGDMATDSNIATSEAQNNVSEDNIHPQQIINQGIPTDDANIFSVSNSETEKSNGATDQEEFSFEANTFAFGSQSGTLHTAPSPNPSPTATQPPITVTPGKGKCVTGIVVYYSDSTYESFVPDPEAKHPFM